MKTLITFLFLALLSSASFGQDVIVKHNGDKVEAKVLEITDYSIRYKRYDQPDGPTRTISKKDVKEIVYENGTWDEFEEEEEEVEEREEVKSEPKRRTSTEKDRLFDSGFSLEGLITYGSERQSFTSQVIVGYDSQGFAIYETQTVSDNYNYAGVNLRIGSKWYFGTDDKFRPGIQVSWARIGMLIDPAKGQFSALFAPLNVGVTNAIRFNDRFGMEANASTGFVVVDLVPIPGNFYGIPTFMYGIEAKFRMGALAIGLDYSRIETRIGDSSRGPINMFSISAGAKF